MNLKRLLALGLSAMLSFMPLSGAAASESGNFVNPKQTYTYDMMVGDLKELALEYPDLIELKEAGKSEYGRTIWAVKLGRGEATVFFNGSHHAREWISTNLLMEMVDEYAQAYETGAAIGSYDVKKVLDQTSIWFIPMVNPDGVTLQQGGLSQFPKDVQTYLIKLNGGSKNFTAWKANAKGVDLNRQYPADWENIKNNVAYPSSQNHKGSKPLAASESKALESFTRFIDPEIAVAYHSSGRILYWHFHNTFTERDRLIASRFSAITGYKLVAPTTNPSGGGYTDWFITTFNRPGFTPELSYPVGNTHVPLSVFDEEWKRNGTIGLFVASEGYKLWYEKNKERIQQEQHRAEVLKNQIEPLLNQINEKEQYIKVNENTLDPQTIEGMKKEIIANKYKVISLYEDIKEYKKALETAESIMFDPLADQNKVFVSLGELYKKVGAAPFPVFLNEQKLDLSPYPLTVKDGISRIPVRAIVNYFNGTLAWDEQTRTVTLTKDNLVMKMVLGEQSVDINGDIHQLPVPVEAIKGHTYLPLKFIAEQMGLTVEWQPVARTILLNFVEIP